MPPQIYQKILNDLGLEYVEDYVSGEDAVNSRFFMQVNSIIIAGKKKKISEEKMIKIIKKHSGVSGFSAYTEIVMFLKSDIKFVEYIS